MAELILDAEETIKLLRWKLEHYATCDLRPGTCGDLYHFELCPSGIGTFIQVLCPCGAIEDLTGDL